MSRDNKDAGVQAGLWPTIIAEVCSINGLVNTEFSHLHTDFLDAAHQLTVSKLTKDHALLLKFWRQHLLDNGWQHESRSDVVGPPARERFSKEFEALFTGRLQTKASTSTFFGLKRVQKFHDAITAAKSITLVDMCMERAIVTTYEDLVQPAAILEMTPDESKAIETYKRKSMVAAHNKAKSTWKQISGKAKNQLHAITACHLCPDHNSKKRIYFLGTDAQYDYFNDRVMHLTSAMDALTHFKALAAWDWLKVNAKTWECLSNAHELERI